MTSLANTMTVQVPGGFRQDDRLYRDAELRPVNGRDEIFLRQVAETLSPAAVSTALLARCVQRMGPCVEVTPDFARSLSVGDREALLLHLRRLSLGESISCVVTCPGEDCGERLDATVSVGDLLVEPYEERPAVHEKTLSADGGTATVRFRLPTGADQEAVADRNATDPRAAADMLLERCLEDGRDGLSSALRAELSRVMAELDPQADLNLQLTCPECGQEFPARLDAGTFLVRELTGHDDWLHREVHLLALCYQWSRSAILAMPRMDRQRHVQLLEDTLSGEHRS